MKYLQLLKIFILIILFGFLIFYSLIWEPYCFFSKAIYSKNISSIFSSKIENYKLKNNLLNNKKDLIIILIPKISLKFLDRLELLDKNFDDSFSTNLLLMYNNKPSKRILFLINKRIKREIFYLNIEIIFNLFPLNLNPCKDKTSYRVRGKWNYLQMIRFWFKILFELPQLKSYEYIMRFDDDSKMLNKWFNLFNEMRQKKSIYFANNIGIDLEKQLPGTMKIKDFTFNYIKQNHINVKQIQLLNNTFQNETILNYYNNFEIINMKFFRQNKISHWINYIDSTNGIFYYRWGDAILRYLTLAIFANKHQILHRNNYNLSYCHKC